MNKDENLFDNKESTNSERRKFLGKGLLLATAAGIGGLEFLTGCSKETGSEMEEEEGQMVTATEDLMQEHGILKRILLIYDTCRIHLINRELFPIEAITNSATIIKSFIEDYHEKQEEMHIFPRFKKANQLTDLVQVLLEQHIAGRKVTEQLMILSKNVKRTDSENQKLIELLQMFNTMYNPHEAREDTILFPAFRKIVSKHEYDSLGEELEKSERKLFGEDGFATIVNKVASIEKSLNIYDLAKFTPKIE